MVTDFGNLIVFPFKVMLTSFQSISIISQILFPFNLTLLEVNVHVILNKLMFPAIFHNLWVCSILYPI